MSAEKYARKSHERQSNHGKSKLGYSVSSNPEPVVRVIKEPDRTLDGRIASLVLVDPNKRLEVIDVVTNLGREYELGRRSNGADLCAFLRHQAGLPDDGEEPYRAPINLEKQKVPDYITEGIYNLLMQLPPEQRTPVLEKYFPMMPEKIAASA